MPMEKQLKCRCDHKGRARGCVQILHANLNSRLLTRRKCPAHFRAGFILKRLAHFGTRVAQLNFHQLEQYAPSTVEDLTMRTFILVVFVALAVAVTMAIATGVITVTTDREEGRYLINFTVNTSMLHSPASAIE